MKVHYPKLYNMAHLSLNFFTASKGSVNYILFICRCMDVYYKRNPLSLAVLKLPYKDHQLKFQEGLKLISVSISIFSGVN